MSRVARSKVVTRRPVWRACARSAAALSARCSRPGAVALPRTMTREAGESGTSILSTKPVENVVALELRTSTSTADRGAAPTDGAWSGWDAARVASTTLAVPILADDDAAIAAAHAVAEALAPGVIARDRAGADLVPHEALAILD